MLTREEIINDILTRSIDQIVDKDRLKKRLLAGEKLRVKLGIDPTSPNIHLGRAVPLLKLKKLQELGCQIVLVIGDFTGTIGDTSDKDAERPMLSKEVVKKNLKTYIEQLSKLINIKKAEIKYNSEWLKKLTYWEIGEQADLFSINEFTSRTNIKTRLDKGSRVSLRELLYPMMQGYDSVMIKADLELGGADQWFNLLAGRTLQKHYGQEPQDILTNVLLEGTDGRKMSSSWGNTINLFDEPKDMYGKVMSLGDDLIITYFTHATDLPIEQIAEIKRELDSGVNPRNIKAQLAFEITKIYWGETGAQEGQDFFNTVISGKQAPDEIDEFKTTATDIIDILVESKLVASKSDARRLIEGNGIKIDGEVIKDFDFKPQSGSVIQKGKRQFIKYIVK
ncbi:MAG: tyrosine--tRNA ligase [Patescibacteria group bacterium]